MCCLYQGGAAIIVGDGSEGGLALYWGLLSKSIGPRLHNATKGGIHPIYELPICKYLGLIGTAL